MVCRAGWDLTVAERLGVEPGNLLAPFKRVPVLGHHQDDGRRDGRPADRIDAVSSDDLVQIREEDQVVVGGTEVGEDLLSDVALVAFARPGVRPVGEVDDDVVDLSGPAAEEVAVLLEIERFRVAAERLASLDDDETVDHPGHFDQPGLEQVQFVEERRDAPGGRGLLEIGQSFERHRRLQGGPVLATEGWKQMTQHCASLAVPMGSPRDAGGQRPGGGRQRRVLGGSHKGAVRPEPSRPQTGGPGQLMVERQVACYFGCPSQDAKPGRRLP